MAIIEMARNAPIAIPAMAPPDRPLLLFPGVGVELPPIPSPLPSRPIVGEVSGGDVIVPGRVDEVEERSVGVLIDPLVVLTRDDDDEPVEVGTFQIVLDVQHPIIVLLSQTW